MYGNSFVKKIALIAIICIFIVPAGANAMLSTGGGGGGGGSTNTYSLVSTFENKLYVSSDGSLGPSGSTILTLTNTIQFYRASNPSSANKDYVHMELVVSSNYLDDSNTVNQPFGAFWVKLLSFYPASPYWAFDSSSFTQSGPSILQTAVYNSNTYDQGAFGLNINPYNGVVYVNHWENGEYVFNINLYPSLGLTSPANSPYYLGFEMHYQSYDSQHYVAFYGTSSGLTALSPGLHTATYGYATQSAYTTTYIN